MTKQHKQLSRKASKQQSTSPGMERAHLEMLLKAVNFQRAGNLDEAEKIYRDLFALYPKDPTLLHLLGVLCSNRGDTEGAIRLMEEGISLNPDAANAFKADYADTYNNYAKALWNLAQYDDALATFEKAINIDPNHATAQFNKGLVKLTLGHYKEGWQSYEWRWQKPDIEGKITFTKPLWLGKESLVGKTILLYAEQGLGDAIQFCRYVPIVKALGAKVLLALPHSLCGLMSTLKGVDHIVTSEQSIIPEYDFHCPLMSLPLALQTTLETIPADIPYLSVNPDKSALWKNTLGIKRKLRIGLVWSGNTKHKNDRNRSIPLKSLTPLFDSGFDFYSLQTEIRKEDEPVFADNKITSFAKDLKDFTDTAALISEMDLILSVDTSVAHLAGALGKPIWILLPLVPDFRWMIEREDSPWYPTARLFRQQDVHNWENVIKKVTNELSTLIN